MAREKRPDDRPIPARPYRDTAVVYGIMALVLIVTAAITGANLLRAVLVAAGFFVLATAWSSWRFRTRIRKRDAAAALTPTGPAADSEVKAGGNGRSGTP